jgi:hypothetical protein
MSDTGGAARARHEQAAEGVNEREMDDCEMDDCGLSSRD